jgi:hypothetical protein
MPTAAPSRKVVGGTAGAGLGGVTASLLLWALGATVFPDGVPSEVSAFVVFVVPVALAFVGGYFTKRSAGELPVPVVEPAPVAKKAAPRKTAKKAAPKPPPGLS